MAKLRITYTKSAIGYSKDQKATVHSLGLRKLKSTVIQEDTPAIRGMIFKVRHLVTAEEISDEPAAKVPAAPSKRTLVLSAADEGAPAADDLAKIEGIGPKIAGVLQAADITTFAQLADTDVARLEEILEAANLRLAAPDSWPAQAKLAAAGNWDALKQLQDQLKGGR